MKIKPRRRDRSFIKDMFWMKQETIRVDWRQLDTTLRAARISWKESKTFRIQRKSYTNNVKLKGREQ